MGVCDTVPTCLPEVIRATCDNTNTSREPLGTVFQIGSSLFESPTSLGPRSLVPQHHSLTHFTSVSSNNARRDEDVQGHQLPLEVEMTGGHLRTLAVVLPVGHSGNLFSSRSRLEMLSLHSRFPNDQLLLVRQYCIVSPRAVATSTTPDSVGRTVFFFSFCKLRKYQRVRSISFEVEFPRSARISSKELS